MQFNRPARESHEFFGNFIFVFALLTEDLFSFTVQFVQLLPSLLENHYFVLQSLPLLQHGIEFSLENFLSGEREGEKSRRPRELMTRNT